MIYLVTSLIRIFSAVATGILKITVYLLRVFGLIIPVFYVIVVFFVNLSLNNVLVENASYFQIILIGFGLSCVGAVILFLRNTVLFPAKVAFLSKRERALEKMEKELSEREERLKEFENRGKERAEIKAESREILQPIKTESPPQKPLKLAEQTEEEQDSHSIFRSKRQYKEGRQKNESKQEVQIFRVRQNPEYLLYDYGDRIELYHETKNGLVYVRTDYNK